MNTEVFSKILKNNQSQINNSLDELYLEFQDSVADTKELIDTLPISKSEKNNLVGQIEYHNAVAMSLIDGLRLLNQDDYRELHEIEFAGLPSEKQQEVITNLPEKTKLSLSIDELRQFANVIEL